MKFNEKVTGNEFTVAGAEIESVEQSADDVTYRITLAEAPADNAVVEISAVNIVDMAGNACTDTISFVRHHSAYKRNYPFKVCGNEYVRR